MQVAATLRYARVSPQKCRLVADTIRGKTVDEALRAITLGAAYTLHMDGEVGSIEAGKRADFAVLEDDPTKVAPQDLKDVPVWGTLQGGRLFRAADL